MKKEYIKLTVRVVKLQQQCHILAGSTAAARSLFPSDEGLNMDPDGLEDSEDDV